MDINHLDEYSYLLEPLDTENHSEPTSLDPLGLQGLAQPDWWAGYDTNDSRFEIEASLQETSLSAAQESDFFRPEGSDSCAENNGSIERFAQSTPAASSEDDLAKGRSSKRLPAGERFMRKNSFQRLPSEAVKTLRLWFHQHQDFPYPTPNERRELEQHTGLNQRQIFNWFANARRRKRRSIGKAPSPSPEVDTAAQSFLSPLERWQHSPPECEPAATSDILRALENAPPSSDWNIVDSSDQSSKSENSSGSSFLFGAPSVGTFEHSGSSGSDLSVKPQNRRFQRPPTPIPSMRPRRRKKVSKSSSRLDKPITHEHRPYQCTFCCDSFRSKYDWVRHEKALHISVDRWRCAPEGGIVETDGVNVCVFCDAPDASDTHLETHNYLRCRDKPPELRVFSRKDHLRQHLRLMHDVQKCPFLDRWRDSTPEIHSRCGFCNSDFKTWEERVDHVAEHFKKRADMSQWAGGWGFEPDVEHQVENAMPPYLLGIERSTVDPMKISNVDVAQLQEGEPSASNGDFPKGVELYWILYNGMVAYIKDQISMGIYPSDEMIQRKARLMIYESDDPWNQTFAENHTWLAAVKNDAGLMEPQTHIALSNEI
ncbi:hypothetical protein P170DRAFT_513460 [Aspergillus steynii IBT 23096]|uniref:Homeobox and C2H2 transcription factor n=1 Tax=Aspergillus steynii IBT 23096 TaxID=1392250 RepID=A0A2I2FUE6_9EURO|nr:uncharacterized protein P170DRAFT_513460 [Aspergillus steynii IBT 23096]PLB44244.1 hypothetical protein P170DRAFT_513460 [Aspergillus steynii IBT 23096]